MNKNSLLLIGLGLAGAYILYRMLSQSAAQGDQAGYYGGGGGGGSYGGLSDASGGSAGTPGGPGAGQGGPWGPDGPTGGSNILPSPSSASSTRILDTLRNLAGSGGGSTSAASMAKSALALNSMIGQDVVSGTRLNQKDVLFDVVPEVKSQLGIVQSQMILDTMVRNDPNNLFGFTPATGGSVAFDITERGLPGYSSSSRTSSGGGGFRSASSVAENYNRGAEAQRVVASPSGALSANPAMFASNPTIRASQQSAMDRVLSTLNKNLGVRL